PEAGGYRARQGRPDRRRDRQGLGRDQEEVLVRDHHVTADARPAGAGLPRRLRRLRADARARDRARPRAQGPREQAAAEADRPAGEVAGVPLLPRGRGGGRRRRELSPPVVGPDLIAPAGPSASPANRGGAGTTLDSAPHHGKHGSMFRDESSAT